MFRRPGSARTAAGILASSQELINQVMPIRMKPGGLQNDAVAERDKAVAEAMAQGDPLLEFEKLLMEQAGRKTPGNFLTDLGINMATSALSNPQLSTTDAAVAGLTGAFGQAAKRDKEEEARKLTSLKGQLDIETAKRARLKEERDRDTSEAAIFNTLYTDDQREALSMMGFTPDFKSGKFKDAKGDLYSISDIQEDPELSKQYNKQLDATKTTVGERYMAEFQDAETYEKAMNNLYGFAAQQKNEDNAVTSIQFNAPKIAKQFAVETKKQLQEEDPNSEVEIQELNVGGYNRTTESAGAITGGHGATVNVTKGFENEDGTIEYVTHVYDPGGNLLRKVTTTAAKNSKEEQKRHKSRVNNQVYGVTSNSRGLLRNPPQR